MASELFDEKAIFNVARQIGSPDARAEYLRQACGADSGLRERVQDLLRAYEAQASFLESPAPVGVSPTIDTPASESPGTIIGPYKLLQQIGEGGMGVVWMAEQTQPVQRKVALKVIKPGMDSGQVIARFEAERQALAIMDHVNIARVFDAGATEAGRPYFVMELVHGVPITKYCDDNHLTPRERLELFVPVCQAIQHAHQKGIIHRDIKPSNVMVTLYDGKPVPKVIDFGVAKATEQKLTERTLFTQYGAMVGTLEYMSPEQAEMSALGVDTRSDIYSLGVLLYELLTGSTPMTHKRMKEAAYAEILRMIKEEEPPRPSTRLRDSGEALASISANRHMEPARLTRLVRGELDWIVMKALEKDRNRRYETANGFAADAQRYLNDEPVQACPPSAWYRFRKFARRNRVAVGMGGVIAVSLVIAVGSLLVGNAALAAKQHQTEVAKRQTEEALEEKKEALDDSERDRRELARALRQSATLALGQGLVLSEQEEVGRGLLWQARALGMIPENSAELERSARLNLHAWGTVLHPLRAVIDRRDLYSSLDWRFSPDGKVLLIKDENRSASRWDTATGRPIGPPLRHDDKISAMAISPDGKALLTVSTKLKPRDKKKPAPGFESWLHLWDAATGKPLRDPIHHPEGIWDGAASFSPDGKTVAAGTRGAVLLWDVATGQRRGQPLPVDGSATFSPDGTFLVSWSRDSKMRGEELTLHSWDAATGKPLRQPITSWLREYRRDLGTLFSPDWKTVLIFTRDGKAQQHDVTTGTPFGQPIEAKQANWEVLYSPDGKVLVTIGIGEADCKTARLWDAASGKPIGSLPHPEPIQGWAFRPDGKQILTHGMDRTVRLWDATNAKPIGRSLAHRELVDSVAFSPDGKLFLTGCRDRTARLWQVPGCEPFGPPIPHEGRVGDVGFSPDGRTLLTRSGLGYGNGGRVCLWALGGRPDRATQHKGRVEAFSPDGSIVLTGTPVASRGFGKGQAQLWDLATGKPLGPNLAHDEIIQGAAISPDGRTVATHFHLNDRTGQHGSVQLWDARAGKLLAPPMIYEGILGGESSLAFSADGKTLATIDGALGMAQLWDVATGKRRGAPMQHPEKVVFDSTEISDAVALSPDGRTLATGGWDKRACLWEVATGKQRAVLPHPSQVWVAAFSPDGRLLLTGGADNRARLWDLATGKMIGPPLEHPGQGAVISAAFSPDGKLAVTGSQDRTARLWEVATGRPIGPALPHQFAVWVAAFTPDGRTVLTGSQDVSRQWAVPTPLDGDARRIALWVQVQTGMELDDHGTVRWLDSATWQERRRRLSEIGGPPLP